MSGVLSIDGFASEVYVDEFHFPLRPGERVFCLVEPYICEGILTGSYRAVNVQRLLRVPAPPMRAPVLPLPPLMPVLPNPFLERPPALQQGEHLVLGDVQWVPGEMLPYLTALRVFIEARPDKRLTSRGMAHFYQVYPDLPRYKYDFIEAHAGAVGLRVQERPWVIELAPAAADTVDDGYAAASTPEDDVGEIENLLSDLPPLDAAPPPPPPPPLPPQGAERPTVITSTTPPATPTLEEMGYLDALRAYVELMPNQRLSSTEIGKFHKKHPDLRHRRSTRGRFPLWIQGDRGRAADAAGLVVRPARRRRRAAAAAAGHGTLETPDGAEEHGPATGRTLALDPRRALAVTPLYNHTLKKPSRPSVPYQPLERPPEADDDARRRPDVYGRLMFARRRQKGPRVAVLQIHGPPRDDRPQRRVVIERKAHVRPQVRGAPRRLWQNLRVAFFERTRS